MVSMLRKRLVLSALLLAACAAPAAETPVADRGSIEVYFSDPGRLDARSYRGGPDQALADAIDAARASVDAAVHDLNLWSIRDALLEAQARGVQVRLVVESDNLAEREEMQALVADGIPVVQDADPDRMHNKFVIIDRYEVWTGSMNYTTNGAYLNRNDLLALRSAAVAERYLAEFEEMFTLGLFGEESPAGEVGPVIQIGETSVEAYFAPEDGVLARLVDLVDGADESVYFMAYSFTSDALAQAMAAAAVRGVEVRGVLDRGQAASNTGGEYEFLRASGVQVRLDGEAGNLHNKLIIIDETLVVTGSYNFSRNAEERNDENLVVIWDSDLAAQYLEQFWTVWELGLDVED